MQITFYDKKTKKVMVGTDDNLFIMNNEVYQDNGHYCESQEASVGFDDFIQKRDDIGWEVKHHDNSLTKPR